MYIYIYILITRSILCGLFNQINSYTLADLNDEWLVIKVLRQFFLEIYLIVLLPEDHCLPISLKKVFFILQVGTNKYLVKTVFDFPTLALSKNVNFKKGKLVSK